MRLNLQLINLVFFLIQQLRDEIESSTFRMEGQKYINCMFRKKNNNK